MQFTELSDNSIVDTSIQHHSEYQSIDFISHDRSTQPFLSKSTHSLLKPVVKPLDIVKLKQSTKIFIAIAIYGSICQSIGLPLFVESFGSSANPYFVLLFSSIMFVIVFGISHFILKFYVPSIQPHLEQSKIFRTGALDALNGIFVVFPSPTTRTPATVSTIIGGFAIPLTAGIRYLVEKKIGSYMIRDPWSLKQKLAFGMSIVAVLLSMIPTFISSSSSKSSSQFQLYFWPAILIIGNAVGALMNVFCEETFLYANDRTYTLPEKVKIVVYFEFYRSIWQMITMIVFSLFDWIPGFGFSSTYPGVWKSFGKGFLCFLGQDVENATCSPFNILLFGILFVSGYLCAYIGSDFLTWEHSATQSTMISTIGTFGSVIFWGIMFGINPHITKHPISLLGVIFASIASILLGWASWVFATSGTLTYPDEKEYSIFSNRRATI